MSQAAKNRSRFRLYLEGIEIPFNSISLNEAEGSFPSAGINLPATLSCMKILPGTIVQVAGPQKLSGYVATQRGKSNEYVLLFEGEVASMGYAKSATGRSLQISCTSLLNRYTTAKAIASDSLAPKLHRNAQMVVTNVNGPFGSLNTGKVKNNQPKVSDDNKENLFTDLQLVDRFGGANYAIVQLIEGVLENGNINQILSKITEHFNKTDYYFHIMDVSFRLKSSLTAFPNKSQPAIATILQQATKNLIEKMKPGSPESGTYNLFSLVVAILEVLRYQFIAPAAPTGGAQVSGSPTVSKGSFEPLRMFFTPDLDTSPPALCNVFFPEDLTNFSYSRAFQSEPTRSLTYMDWNEGSAGTVGQYGINYAIPDMSLIGVNFEPKDINGNPSGDPEGTFVSTYTAEEAYQGCRPIFSPVDPIFVQVANTTFEQRSRTVDNVVNDDANISFSKAMKNEALKIWMANKYKSRTVQVTADWNPSRLIGVPGLIVDPGFPSLIGVVSSIQTSISADGRASSNITFRSVRVVYDEDPDAYKSSDDSVYPHALKVTDNETFPTLDDFLYQPDLYAHSEVGRDIYSYLTLGTKPAKGGPNGQDGALETLCKDSPETWNVDKNIYTNIMQEPFLYDQSILSYIRSSDNPAALTLLTEMDDSEDTPEELYAKRLYLAIKNIKTEYQSMISGDGVRDYLDNLNYRQLVPFEEYLGYIQATNKDSNLEYKDSISILADKDRASETFQTLLDNAVDLQEAEDSFPTGSTLKSLKLDNGLDALVPTINHINELIAQYKLDIQNVTEQKVTKVEEEKTKFESENAFGAAGKITYTIQGGDTLAAIAAMPNHNSSIDAILAANPSITDPDLIIAGSQISIPTSPSAQNMESTAQALEELITSTSASFDEKIQILNDRLMEWETKKAELQNGITPGTPFDPDDLKAIYRPYDETRRAHVKIAFSELQNNDGDVKITK